MEGGGGCGGGRGGSRRVVKGERFEVVVVFIVAYGNGGYHA